jgi:hypothetical protein
MQTNTHSTVLRLGCNSARGQLGVIVTSVSKVCEALTTGVSTLQAAIGDANGDGKSVKSVPSTAPPGWSPC